MSEEKKGFFARLKEGLTKTRNNIVKGIDSIFSGFSSIDDDFYEELEETLIMGDLGVNATAAILERLKKQVKEQGIREPEACRQLLIDSIREQMDVLDEKGISYDYCPGVSSFSGAAAALNLEYTLPNVSQSVIITRMAGRTPVPEKESIESFAAHQATMVVFLSTGMLEELSRRLIEGGYKPDTPAAIVYKATWEDEKKFVCTVGTLAQTAKENNITKTALMIIGDVVSHNSYDRSLLYHPEFTTEFRKGTGPQ